MPTRWKLKRIRVEVGAEIGKEKSQYPALVLGLLKEKICAQMMKSQARSQPHTQGKAGGPWLQSLPFITFDLLQSRQEALT